MNTPYQIPPLISEPARLPVRHASISRSGVDQFRGGTVSPDSIARALQTGTLVRGTVEQEGDKLRVGIRLVDGNSGADLERASFERSSVDLLGVRDSFRPSRWRA